MGPKGCPKMSVRNTPEERRFHLIWWCRHGLALHGRVQSNLSWHVPLWHFLCEFKTTSHLIAKFKEKSFIYYWSKYGTFSLTMPKIFKYMIWSTDGQAAL